MSLRSAIRASKSANSLHISPHNAANSARQSEDSASPRSSGQNETQGYAFPCPAVQPAVSPAHGSRVDQSRLLKFVWRLQRNTPIFRFTLLLLSCWIVFAGYFAFDAISITADGLREHLTIDNRQIGILFSVYALPNSVIPMLSGIFFTKFGNWKGVLIIAGIITVGTAAVCLGVSLASLYVMVLGRLIYGIGGESVYVGIDILVTKWFKGAQMALAYGVIQAAGQAGSFAAFYLGPILHHHFKGIVSVYVASTMITTIAFCLLVMGYFIDLRAYTGKPGGRRAGVIRDVGNDTSANNSSNALESNSAKVELCNSGPAVGSNETDGYGDEDGADDTGFEEDSEETEKLEALSPFRKTSHLLHISWMALGLSHVRQLGNNFWCVLGSIVCYSAAFYSFLAFGPVWLTDKYGYDEDAAGRTVGTVSLCSILLSPLWGLLVDAKGGHAVLSTWAMAGGCACFAAMGYTSYSPTVLTLLAGFCYSALPSALYSLLTEIVPDKAFTPVYALVNSCVNILLSLAYYATGWLTYLPIDGTKGAQRVDNFQSMFYLFCAMTGVGTYLSFRLLAPYKRRFHILPLFFPTRTSD